MSNQASYQPPFTLTPVSLRLVAEIAEAIGRLSAQAASPQVAPQVTPQVERLLQTLAAEMSREEIQSKIGLKDRKSFRARYLKPALAEDLI